MGDRTYRLNAAVCALRAEDADKLISAGDGDSALLYIYLLRRGQVPDAELCRDLGWEPARLSAAAGRLRGCGLISGEPGAERRAAPEEALPEYTSGDVVKRSGEDPAFRSLLAETEQLLGRTLSSADTRMLFGVYDYLGLPVDVIMELLHHCAEQCRTRFGPGRVPTMRQIEKEAYVWANQEIMTIDRAEEYIAEKARRHDMCEVLRLAFGLRDRQFSATERKYVEGWLAQGFTQEAIELAYDKTVTNTGQLKWAYMDRIMQSWHGKGLHTVKEIEAGDRPKRQSAQPARGPEQGGGELERMRKIYDKVRKG